MGRRRLVEGARLVFLDFETTGIGGDAIPISVGAVVTDHELKVVGEFGSKLMSQAMADLYERDGAQPVGWLPHHQAAFDVHKIGLADVLSAPYGCAGIVGQIKKIAKPSPDRRPILVSDNAPFEHRMMQLVHADGHQEWCWHHATWDASLLLEMCDEADQMRGKKHDALDDARRLHAAVLAASRVIGEGLYGGRA